MIVAIDAGHGGIDKGGRSLGLPESRIALDFARLINLSGHKAVLTRSGDTTTALQTRTLVANRTKADVFVSFHGNASSNPERSGPWTIYMKGSERSRLIAIQIQKALASVLGGDPNAVHTDASPSVGYTTAAQTAIESGRRQGLNAVQSLRNIDQPYRTLFVLRQTTMPAVLIELGFMTNAQDIVKMSDPTIRKHVCLEIGKVLVDIFDPTVPHVVTPVPSLDLKKIQVPTRNHVEAIVAENKFDVEDVRKGLLVAETLLKGVAAVKSGNVKTILELLLNSIEEYRG
jgi:N-acetylmuramoyl-L-alanine amidase